MKAVGAVAGLFFVTSAVCAELPQYEIDAYCKALVTTAANAARSSNSANQDYAMGLCTGLEKKVAK
jgi:hypothetical protein